MLGWWVGPERQQGVVLSWQGAAANGLLSVAIKDLTRGGAAITTPRPRSAATGPPSSSHTIATSVASPDRKRRLTSRHSAQQNDQSRRASLHGAHLRVTGGAGGHSRCTRSIR